MKTTTLRRVYAAVSLLVGMGSVFPVLATRTGAQALGSKWTAVDAFVFTCPAGTFSAQANVEDLIPPLDRFALMRVMLVKNHRAAVAEDLNPLTSAGEGGGPSPNAVLFGKSGRYLMLFYKAAVGLETYRGSALCNTPQGPINPVLNRTQNQ